MSSLSHPSPLAPALPTVVLELADGWRQVPAGAALLRAVGQESDGPAPSLKVLVRAESPDTDVESVLHEGFPPGDDIVVDPAFAVEFSGHQWTGVNLSGQGGPGGTPWVEVHLATTLAEAGPAVRQVVVITGRTCGPHIEADYAALQGMIETVEVSSATADRR